MKWIKKLGGGTNSFSDLKNKKSKDKRKKRKLYSGLGKAQVSLH